MMSEFTFLYPNLHPVQQRLKSYEKHSRDKQKGLGGQPEIDKIRKFSAAISYYFYIIIAHDIFCVAQLFCLIS